MWWLDIKHAVETYLGQTDVLHFYAGLLVYLAVVKVTGWSMADRRPWLIVLAAAVLNEGFDAAWGYRLPRPKDSLFSILDVVDTMLVPTTLWAAAHHFRRSAPGMAEPAARHCPMCGQPVPDHAGGGATGAALRPSKCGGE